MNIKPDLTIYFAAMPFIGQYLMADYEKAETLDDLVNLAFKWLDISETTNNPVKKVWHKVSYHYLYSVITNKSYESIIL